MDITDIKYLEINDDIIILIFSHIEVSDWNNVMCVCKYWYELSKVVFKRKYKIDSIKYIKLKYEGNIDFLGPVIYRKNIITNKYVSFEIKQQMKVSSGYEESNIIYLDTNKTEKYELNYFYSDKSFFKPQSLNNIDRPYEVLKFLLLNIDEKNKYAMDYEIVFVNTDIPYVDRKNQKITILYNVIVNKNKKHIIKRKYIYSLSEIIENINDIKSLFC